MLVVNDPILTFEVTEEFVVIVLVAHPKVLVQPHSLFLGLGFLQMLLAVLSECVEVPLLY